ncbi:MAG: hypothetical protein V4710_23730 [Verrucomicrobiota bacterium]
MKKFLFATLLFVGLGTLVPEARADNHEWYGNYDKYHGRSSYERHYRHSDRRDRSYRRDGRCYDSPRVIHRHRPVRVYEEHTYCAPRVRYYQSRPRISVFLGF